MTENNSKTNKLIAIAVLILLSSVCEAQVMDVEITKKDLKMPKAKLSEIAATIEFIPLESNPKCYINTALAFQVEQAGANWLVQSMPGNKAFIFDSTGQFVAPVGSQGKGPGEYTRFYKVAWDDQLVRFVMLLSNNTINLYLPDGGFDRQIKIEGVFEVKRILIAEKCWYLLWIKPQANNQTERGLVVYNRSEGQLESIPIDYESEYPAMQHWWNWCPVYFQSGELVSGTFPAYELYTLSDGKVWKPRLKLELPIKKLPKNLLIDQSRSGEMGQHMGQNGFLQTIQEFQHYYKISFSDPSRYLFLLNKDNGDIISISTDYNKKIQEGFIDNLGGGPVFNPIHETSAGQLVGLSAAMDFVGLKFNPVPSLTHNSNPVIVVVGLK